MKLLYILWLSFVFFKTLLAQKEVSIPYAVEHSIKTMFPDSKNINCAFKDNIYKESLKVNHNKINVFFDSSGNFIRKVTKFSLNRKIPTIVTNMLLKSDFATWYFEELIFVEKLDSKYYSLLVNNSPDLSADRMQCLQKNLLEFNVDGQLIKETIME